MPLDSTSYKEAEAKPDLSKPTLEGLSWALRHLPEVRTNHTYDHSVYWVEHECRTAGCALGLACNLWPQIGHVTRYTNPRRVADMAFGPGSYDRFFTLSAHGYGGNPTATQVADNIDVFLARQKG